MFKHQNLCVIGCLTLNVLGHCDARSFLTPKSIVQRKHSINISDHDVPVHFDIKNEKYMELQLSPTSSCPLSIPRGGASPLSMVTESSSGLASFMKGTKADILILFLTTALNTPICQKLNISPILGFLSLGLLFGPNGKGVIADVHTTEIFADLGIVLFLFEMGIHLDLKTLLAMKKDVFGIGLTQFTATALAIAGICKLLGYSVPAMIIIGWSLALSSSAFVLQLLKDKGQMNTQYGRSSFGTLLLQVRLLVFICTRSNCMLFSLIKFVLIMTMFHFVLCEGSHGGSAFGYNSNPCWKWWIASRSCCQSNCANHNGVDFHWRFWKTTSQSYVRPCGGL